MQNVSFGTEWLCGKKEGDSRLGLLCLSRHQPRALPMLRPLSAPPVCHNRKIHLSSLYVTMPSVWSVHLRMHWCSSSSTTFYVSCLYNNSCLTASIFCFVWLVLCDFLSHATILGFVCIYIFSGRAFNSLAGRSGPFQVGFHLGFLKNLVLPSLVWISSWPSSICWSSQSSFIFFVLQFWFYLHVIMMSAEGNWGFFSNCIRRVNWDYVQELVRAFGLVTAILSLF